MLISLSKTEVELLLLALPMVGDREVEEERPEDERCGEACDTLWNKLDAIYQDWRVK
jgi:hypothetical protein